MLTFFYFNKNTWTTKEKKTHVFNRGPRLASHQGLAVNPERANRGASLRLSIMKNSRGEHLRQ